MDGIVRAYLTSTFHDTVLTSRHGVVILLAA